MLVLEKKRGAPQKTTGAGSHESELILTPLPWFSLYQTHFTGEVVEGATFSTKHGTLFIVLPENKEGTIFPENLEA